MSSVRRLRGVTSAGHGGVSRQVIKEEALRVFVRVRQRFDGESNVCDIVSDTELRVQSSHDGAPHPFHFDQVFAADDDGPCLFEHIGKPLVSRVLEGYTATMLTFGHRQVQKTHTMFSTNGLIPCTFSHVFDTISVTSGRNFLVRTQYLCVMGEEVIDMLASDQTRSKLTLSSDGDGGEYAVGATSFVVRTCKEAQDIVDMGTRAQAQLLRIRKSSACHTVFIVTIESSAPDGDGAVIGRLLAVDLGTGASPRPSSATSATSHSGGDAQGVGVGVGVSVGVSVGDENGSLDVSGLSSVISALAAGAGNVPFKGSPMGRMLKVCLGGHGVCALVGCISPCAEDFTCTLRTLRYGSKARTIINSPKPNSIDDGSLLPKFQCEIARLSHMLDAPMSPIVEQVKGLPLDQGLARLEEEARLLRSNSDGAAGASPISSPVNHSTRAVLERKLAGMQGKILIGGKRNGGGAGRSSAGERNLGKSNHLQGTGSSADHAEYVNEPSDERSDGGCGDDEMASGGHNNGHRSSAASNTLSPSKHTARGDVASSLRNREVHSEPRACRTPTHTAVDADRNVNMQDVGRVLRWSDDDVDHAKMSASPQRIATIASTNADEDDADPLDTEWVSETMRAIGNDSVGGRALQRLLTQHDAIADELSKARSAAVSDRNDMMETIRVIARQLKFANCIVSNFVPPEEVAKIEKRATWDSAQEEWVVSRVHLAGNNAVRRRPRPRSATTDGKRSLSAHAKLRASTDIESTRWCAENVIRLNQEAPVMTSGGVVDVEASVAITRDDGISQVHGTDDGAGATEGLGVDVDDDDDVNPTVFAALHAVDGLHDADTPTRRSIAFEGGGSMAAMAMAIDAKNGLASSTRHTTYSGGTIGNVVTETSSSVVHSETRASDRTSDRKLASTPGRTPNRFSRGADVDEWTRYVDPATARVRGRDASKRKPTGLGVDTITPSPSQSPIRPMSASKGAPCDLA